MKSYKVIISPKVVEQIKSIRNYIRDIKLNPSAAEKTVETIFEEIEGLKSFPERGFNADNKLGVKINKSEKTYGIIILNGKYIVLYSVDNVQILVNIAYLFSTKTDYATMFLE